MGIKVALRHQTKYVYDRAIKLWPQIIRLRPAPHSRTSILSYSLNVSPSNHFINWMQDPFGNYQARVVFPESVKDFAIDVEIIAELVTINPFDFFLEEYAERFPFSYDELLQKELQPYLVKEESGDLMQSLYLECQKYKDQNTVDFLVSINSHLYRFLNYTIRMETGVQSCETTLEKRLGSCRDFSWVLVQLLRHFGLAARFVSGYLVQLTPDEKSKEGPSGPDTDFTDLHAWAEVYIPGAGWVGLDSTSGLFAGEGHIPLACTPHPRSAAPVTGATEVTTVQFEFNNSVDRIEEQSRVTKPYTLEQWQEIKSLGHVVDDILLKGDVRLTMGGEPTFISAKDMESDQWNNDADGLDKRRMAYELSLRLKTKYAPNGLVHFGQGKWYPGEAIPRWQYGLLWRNDKEPIWKDESLLANPNEEGTYNLTDAHDFIKSLSSHLALSAEFVSAAYEDKYYYMWEEQNLPVNFNSEKNAENAKIEQQTLIDVLKHGIDNPKGYVLPLHWDEEKKEWESCKWDLKRESLFLVPGNSQMGHRLPLDRIEIQEEEVDEIEVPTNHFDDNRSLPKRELIENKIQQRKLSITPTNEADRIFKTTLCVELVEGRIHVFLPPTVDMAEALDLMTALEMTCEDRDKSIIIEGYQLPYHKEVTKLVVAPDPGVIEVNVHPTNNWQELLTLYDDLFEAADDIGLGTNKFMLDGKHTGTGGGNHITLGGVSPEDSPLLRKPDLLRSMINFWQNHPGLSYLFSSAFIGPTSQAPRIDEGRPDIIYELDIAFKELEQLENPPFWAVDRILRNLLTDITGNTHRAEFCIDKLYSPDSQTGRLGILELRGFDMPPHKEMCIVQLLLIRSLVAVFWNNPYKNKLINWGTDLHNKFMMNHFVKEDMFEVVDYLNRYGVPFKKEWLDVFLDFKFPIYGNIHVSGVNMTLRAGIEPWIVLGEEMSSTGTARFVDSSVERLEVLLEDINIDRYSLLCNSIQVPLIKTPYKGKYVASIRYKAWAPSSALHPTIGVNTPLVFDLYDKWNDRSVGGCTYHVLHPGGRSYDSFPVNSLEAESRRMTRFWEFNHTPKSNVPIQNQTDGSYTSYIVAHEEVKDNVTVKHIPPSHEFPHTLDLRRG